MATTTATSTSKNSSSRFLPSTNSLCLDMHKVHPSATRPPSPQMEFATPPTRTITPPPIMKLPHSFATKQVSHPPHLQLKVSDPYITMDKKLATLKIPSACETPLHYTPPPPFPETSPSENKMMDADFAKRKKGTRRGTLNPEAKNVLKAWMFSPEHFAHPYPSEEEKEELAAEAGIEVKQLSNCGGNSPASSSDDSFEHHTRDGFRDVEILAAKSLLGLHREYQPVH
ncbi:hypothetical protein DYB28_000068 [Aphanomyces astaci]|uniref:KN homeodomain domain-containing protein n=1 Tax=Aphanomyces astaci TaxID=112090 RepID=A0A397AFM5_APHAT|nr:hypothetical protein DYB36_001398 [Aphanomyces astaci]RLO06800.1 hypothetical protein DYB28_000068 [Aphanomyces astaci]